MQSSVGSNVAKRVYIRILVLQKKLIYSTEQQVFDVCRSNYICQRQHSFFVRTVTIGVFGNTSKSFCGNSACAFSRHFNKIKPGKVELATNMCAP